MSEAVATQQVLLSGKYHVPIRNIRIREWTWLGHYSIAQWSLEKSNWL